MNFDECAKRNKAEQRQVSAAQTLKAGKRFSVKTSFLVEYSIKGS